MSIVGTVKYFNSAKGFGYLTADDGYEEDIFLHIDRIVHAPNEGMTEGRKVKFDIEKGPGGEIRATNCSVIQE